MQPDEFAAGKGKIAEKIVLNERGPGFLRFAKVEYTFRLVDPKPTEAEMEKPAEEAEEKSGDLYTEILRLDDLRQRGLITDEEFGAEKRELLEAN